MAGFDDAALGVAHRDGEPSMTETIDAGDPGGVHWKVLFRFWLRGAFRLS